METPATFRETGMGPMRLESLADYTRHHLAKAIIAGQLQPGRQIKEEAENGIAFEGEADTQAQNLH
jgi:hypothetical protein